jgi:hypothetical protein
MLTETFRRLGAAARLPLLDFLIFDLAFDFAFDFAFFGMAGQVQRGWVYPSKDMHGQDGPGDDASQGQVSAARRFGKPADDVEDSACARIALGGLPAQMAVRLDVEVSAKTVRELRELTAWPENLAITTPQDAYPDSAVRVSKVSVAARTSPKS